MSVLDATDFVLPGRADDGGLDISVTRYRPRNSPTSSTSGDTYALLFIHGVSFHKESFLPTIEYLFQIQSTVQESTCPILEAWVLDSPNHGRAGVLNATRLLSRPLGLSAHEWARAAQVFLKSGLMKGTKIVGIGHSAGTVTVTLSTWGCPLDQLPYSSLIFVEPSMMTREILARLTANGKAWDDLIEMAKARRDIWASRAAARQWMANRLPWKTWTPRAIDLFVEHALCDLPTPTYPDRTTGVTLSCTRAQEAVGYIYHQDAIDSINRVSELCPVIPVHTIFGDRLDIVPDFIKKAVVDEKAGRKMTTITSVPGAGHLVPMEDPKGLAKAVWNALYYGQPRGNLSKL
ncbi:alpha/beta-hydrolase [Earliella scabrosa]|nr:alpha/beta-hydrolase [Earliella scabrosa]